MVSNVQKQVLTISLKLLGKSVFEFHWDKKLLLWKIKKKLHEIKKKKAKYGSLL